MLRKKKRRVKRKEEREKEKGKKEKRNSWVKIDLKRLCYRDPERDNAYLNKHSVYRDGEMA